MAQTKAKTAKTERGKAVPSVIIAGKKFTLPKKLSHRLLLAYEENSVKDIVEILFGDQADAYWDLDLSLEESAQQIGEILKKLGLTSGE